MWMTGRYFCPHCIFIFIVTWHVFCNCCFLLLVYITCILTVSIFIIYALLLFYQNQVYCTAFFYSCIISVIFVMSFMFVWSFYFDLCHIELSVDGCCILEILCMYVCMYRVSQYYAGVHMLTAVAIFGSVAVSKGAWQLSYAWEGCVLLWTKVVDKAWPRPVVVKSVRAVQSVHINPKIKSG